MTTTSRDKIAYIDATKIGECAATQPVSGISCVGEAGTVNGHSHGGYMRVIKPETTPASTDTPSAA